MQRDFVGYGQETPSFEWPNGCRLAVNVVMNYEEGSELSPLEGDSAREKLVEAWYDVPRGERELFAESSFEYGSRVGVWRVLELMDRYEVTPTIFAIGQALERNPAAATAFADRGCNVVVHGYRWIPQIEMSVEDQRQQFQKCIDSIVTTTGYEPKGCFIRPPNTLHTRQLAAEAGLLYDSGAVNDDVPYFVDVLDRPFLVLPYTLDVNDTKFVKNQFFTSADFATYTIDTFDVLYAESRRRPRMMSVGLHPRIIGQPARILGLARFLEHIKGYDDVWIAGRDEIATFWAERFAPDGTWNWPPGS